MSALRRDEILSLLQLLDRELERDGVRGELYLVGGAVMCLAFDARRATYDLDGFFRPARAVRTAARRVAEARGLPEDWLNDGAKGFLSEQGEFREHLALPSLQVLIASPEYLLAMKCLAMRIGGEFHDREDVRFLLRYLNIGRYDTALETIARYYPPDRIPQKTLYALEEMIADLAEA